MKPGFFISSVALVSLALVACGGGAAPASPHDAAHAHCACGGDHDRCACDHEHCACGGKHEHGDEEGREHHEESALPAPLREFHDVLGPLWHSEKGPDRVTKTCAAAGTLHDKATATGDAELVTATTDLQTECAKDGRPDFEARFTAVHEKFHAAAKRARP